MSDESLKSRVETWMVKQMPIIQMHGGTSMVRECDPESGQVVVELLFKLRNVTDVIHALVKLTGKLGRYCLNRHF